MYWFRYLPETLTAYVQINEMGNDGGPETLAEMFHRAVATTDSVPVDRFVVDLRYNGGGSSNAVRPMVIDLVKSEALDHHGRLFVLIGRNTASAAQNFVNALEQYTKAIFVGEPTGQNPNFYSDSPTIQLPNSALYVFAASAWMGYAGPHDRRRYTAPHVAADLTSTSFMAGRDPALEAVLAYAGVVPLPEAVATLAVEQGVLAAGDSLAVVSRGSLGKYRNLSQDMIRYAFDVLWTKGRIEQAVALLEANVVGHPEDWNSHDALAGAYENQERWQEALEEYERAHSLNAEHDGIRNGIRRVKARLGAAT